MARENRSPGTDAPSADARGRDETPGRQKPPTKRLTEAGDGRRKALPVSRRKVLAGVALGAALMAGLGACNAPASLPVPTVGDGDTAKASADRRLAPSRAIYEPSLIVQRAESNDQTKIALANWRLRVDGLVGKPLDLSYDDLKGLRSVTQISSLYCVEGWGVVDLRWEGVRLATLLEAVEALPRAKWVSFDTFPGDYQDSLSLEQARLGDVLLAYRLGDAPLTEDAGFPLRLVVPRMYGFKSVKWLNRISLVENRSLGFWEKVGYPPDAWFS